MSDYIYVKVKAPFNREELLSLFWSRSEFSQIRKEMTAYFKKENPDMNNEQIKFIVTEFVYEMAKIAYDSQDNITDMLSLLRNDYFQKRLKNSRLQDNGKTFAKNEKEKKANEPMTLKEKFVCVVLVIAVVGYIIDAIIGLFT